MESPLCSSEFLTRFKSLIFTGPSVKSGLAHPAAPAPVESTTAAEAVEDEKHGKKATPPRRREYNQSAIDEGYVARLEEATGSGVALPFSDSRTGRFMNKMGGDGHWKRWKNVDIVEQGGLEALWQRDDKVKGKTEGEGQAPEAESGPTSAISASPRSHVAGT